MIDTAQIIVSYGRHYIACTLNGKACEASTCEKRANLAYGNRAYVQTVDTGQTVVEDYPPRESLLYHQGAWKIKLIVADVSRLLTVTVVVPSLNEALLQRVPLVAEAVGIQAVIALNKADLPETALWCEELKFYETLGYSVIETRTLENVDIPCSILQRHTNILFGQSGMGRSTLTSALLGDQTACTGDTSTALDFGKRTITHAQLYDLSEETQSIDSPGLQEFGLHHLQAADLL